ncbi:MAG: hypothetical protein PHU97_09900 [Bacteroidales bacterium]|nr:hypothetical protein [Bacteroidales bacterium]MDD3960505.1 hypothetical protein [Bacteroidales bacterium]
MSAEYLYLKAKNAPPSKTKTILLENALNIYSCHYLIERPIEDSESRKLDTYERKSQWIYYLSYATLVFNEIYQEPICDIITVQQMKYYIKYLSSYTLQEISKFRAIFSEEGEVESGFSLSSLAVELYDLYYPLRNLPPAEIEQDIKEIFRGTLDSMSSYNNLIFLRREFEKEALNRCFRILITERNTLLKEFIVENGYKPDHLYDEFLYPFILAIDTLQYGDFNYIFNKEVSDDEMAEFYGFIFSNKESAKKGFLESSIAKRIAPESRKEINIILKKIFLFLI